MLFENLNLVPPILRALQEEGYTTPTPIQAQAIPFLLQRHDLLGCAQTGTGKTAAFAIPILQLLSEEKSEPRRPIRALILTPTRELAIQIEESFKAYGRHLDLRHTVIFGGVSQHAQTETLRRGVDILVATPGRLLDLMQQRFISLQQVKMFIWVLSMM
jgi:ATP-dependent RNA helicase RhlE